MHIAICWQRGWYHGISVSRPIYWAGFLFLEIIDLHNLDWGDTDENERGTNRM